MSKDNLQEYVRFISKGEMIRALNILEGMVKGMAIDGKINAAEIKELQNWYHLHKYLLEHLAFYDLLAVLDEALSNAYLSAESKADILWLCSRYTANNIYQDFISNDIQILQGLLYGIMADNKIELLEIERLGQWLADHEYLNGIYPYDELCSIISSVLQDGKLSNDEMAMLKAYFSEFIEVENSANLNEAELSELRKSINISGICASNPKLVFNNKLFSFTGASTRNWMEIKEIIESRGGLFKSSIVRETDYLIVGDKNHPAWPFSCYGRKVEQVVKMRKAGSSVLIVHENDFWNQIQTIKLYS